MHSSYTTKHTSIGTYLNLKPRTFQLPAFQQNTMATNRLWRTLSAFNPSTRRWAPTSSTNTQSQRNALQRLSLTSWNIDAFSPRATSRAERILGHILKGPKAPDVVFLQEVTPEVRGSLLNDGEYVPPSWRLMPRTKRHLRTCPLQQ